MTARPSMRPRTLVCATRIPASFTVPGNDLVHGATKVEIDEVRLYPIDYCQGGFSHFGRIGSEKLHSDRTFLRAECDHLAGTLVAMQDPIRRDEFSHDHIGAVFF